MRDGAAAGAARRAFEATDWGRDRALRSRALLELAELFDARAPDLAVMLTRENGKTLPEATGEVGAPTAILRHNAAQALTDVDTAAEVAPGRYFSSLTEPVGVVAIVDGINRNGCQPGSRVRHGSNQRGNHLHDFSRVVLAEPGWPVPRGIAARPR